MKPFAFETQDNFPDHVTRSVPSKSRLDVLTRELVRSAISGNEHIIDLGCNGSDLLDRIDAENKVGYDIVEPEGYDANKWVFIKKDLNDLVSLPLAQVIVCNLTLHFLQPAARANVLRCIDEALVFDGLFICTEKVALDPFLQRPIKREQRNRKLAQGFSVAEIEAKDEFMRTHMFSVSEQQFAKEMSMIGRSSTIWADGDFIAKAVIK